MRQMSLDRARHNGFHGENGQLGRQAGRGSHGCMQVLVSMYLAVALKVHDK